MGHNEQSKDLHHVQTADLRCEHAICKAKRAIALAINELVHSESIHDRCRDLAKLRGADHSAGLVAAMLEGLHVFYVVSWQTATRELSEERAEVVTNEMERQYMAIMQAAAKGHVMLAALEWYAARHRPEDYLNDNGDRAIAALQEIGHRS